MTGARPPSLGDLRYPDLHNDPGLKCTLNARNKVRVSPFLRHLHLRRPASVLLNCISHEVSTGALFSPQKCDEVTHIRLSPAFAQWHLSPSEIVIMTFSRTAHRLSIAPTLSFLLYSSKWLQAQRSVCAGILLMRPSSSILRRPACNHPAPKHVCTSPCPSQRRWSLPWRASCGVFHQARYWIRSAVGAGRRSSCSARERA